MSFELPAPDGEGGLRRLANSKKKRGDLPEVVLGLAINRDGLPVRHWVFPGNTVVDVTTVEGVVKDLLGLRPRRFLFIGDRGMVSQDNLDFLESRRLHYLLGSKLRDDAVVQTEVLSLRGRYRAITDTLGVKETRGQDGGLAIDRSRGRDDERYDGKYVLMTNELDLDAEELVLGYRDMWRAERAFRSMKTVLRIEPVHHREERRILAHAHLCVLAYLLTRIAENRTEQSWPVLRERLERVSLARIETDHAAIFRVKHLKGSEAQLWNSCHLEPPPKTLQGTV